MGSFLSLLLGVCLQKVLPAYYAPQFPWIVLGFVVFDVVFLYIVRHLSKRVSSVRLAQVYMSVTPIKLMLSVVIVYLCSTLSQSVHIKPFAINFACLYLLFLSLETRALVQLEKLLKAEKEQ